MPRYTEEGKEQGGHDDGDDVDDDDGDGDGDSDGAGAGDIYYRDEDDDDYGEATLRSSSICVAISGRGRKTR